MCQIRYCVEKDISGINYQSHSCEYIGMYWKFIIKITTPLYLRPYFFDLASQKISRLRAVIAICRDLLIYKTLVHRVGIVTTDDDYTTDAPAFLYHWSLTESSLRWIKLGLLDVYISASLSENLATQTRLML